MRLRRLGELLLLLGVGSLLLPALGGPAFLYGGVIDQLAAGLCVGMFGMILVIAGASSSTRTLTQTVPAQRGVKPFSGRSAKWDRPNRSFASQMAQIGLSQPARLSHSGLIDPAVHFLPPMQAAQCLHCRKPVRAGARFCTRCGAAVTAPVPPLPRLVPSPPPLHNPQKVRTPAAARTPATPRRKRPFPLFRMVLVFALILGGAYVLAYWHDYGRMPWSQWQWVRDLERSPISEVTTRRSFAPALLPACPSPGDIRTRTSGESPSIEHAWVETGATDFTGSVGLRIHARVRVNGAQNTRLVAHFRFADSSPVLAADSQYADPNDQAAAVETILPYQGVVEAGVFIPETAMLLNSANQDMMACVSLFNSTNDPVSVLPPVPFTLYRGAAYLTRVCMEPVAAGYIYAAYPTSFRVNVRSHDHLYGLRGEVVIRFKDANGRPFAGRPPYSNAAGELMVANTFNIPPGRGEAVLNDVTVHVPPGLIPASSTAEVSLFDLQSGRWLTTPVVIKMP